ncbi:TBC1 domain family member 1 isoform X2 [Nematostella vectensis]|uniref:TBC1 domain family member 1 isoform X2 n=1 Tax=Nematostella vectensis TaxID=45351 RepID=UPI00207793D0|nr:TBC1 domain family member 1 isoform X2 [Nematostella vectensis]
MEVQEERLPMKTTSKNSKNLSLDSGLGSFEESEPMEARHRSMTTATEEIEAAKLVESQSGIINGGDLPIKAQRFHFVYLGFAVVDRRYTQHMLPWVISEIRRRKERQSVYLCVEAATVTAVNTDENGSAAFQHGVQNITRCARSYDKKCFAYLVKSNENSCSCFCYAFEAADPNSVPGFIHCLRENCDMACDPANNKPKRKISANYSGNQPVNSVPSEEHIMVSYPLCYIGRVNVSHRQAPPTLIDDSVSKFRNLNRRKELEEELNNPKRPPLSRTMSSSVPKRQPPPELYKAAHKNTVRVTTVDEEKITNTADKDDEPLQPSDVQRPRSASDGDKKLFALPTKERCDSDHTRNANKAYNTPAANRSVLLRITSQHVSVISTSSSGLLLEKKLREISFCQQGTKNADHFGFICREQCSSQYVCFVFKGESESLVDSVMRSLKEAFHAAWQAAGSTKVCELCPLHHLHQLCTQLENLQVQQQHETLKKHLTTLSDMEMNQFTDKYKAETHGTEITELSEDVDVIMGVLRSLYEKRQRSHSHIPSTQIQAKDSVRTGILQKAKKSLTSSLENFRSKRSDETKPSPATRRRSHTLDTITTSPTPSLTPIGEAVIPQRVLDSMPVHQQRMLQAQSLAQARLPRNKSSESLTVQTKFSRNRSTESLPDEALSGNSSSPPATPTKPHNHVHKRLSRRHSYRQNIFHSVVTPSKRNSISPQSELTWSDVTGRKRSSQELRALWRKAIMEQILLNRMERENQTLDDFQRSKLLKRLKLSYDEGSVCHQTAAAKWDQLLSRPWDVQVEMCVLRDAVKAGVPKDKRGEIWEFLAKQYSVRSPASKDAFWKAGSYEEMRDGSCNHQHSIFIDLGRTFPRHPYFTSQFGPGQLSLFNLLKAYSVLDTDVGYCQGLSFVAGILLMHMEEAKAFDVMRHLLFALDLRKLYKSDMTELQIQFYVLSRLLHDYHTPLYEFLEELDITPTLYAAAWFLTLFASQFPVGFVVRVMDMIFLQGITVCFKVMLLLLSRCKEGIMECDGFECAVDYIKTHVPPYAFAHMDSLVAQVLDMDICKELESYVIEYNVLREEDLSLASVEEFEHQRAKKLEQENKVLSKHLQEVSEQLTCARSTISSLEGTIHTMQMNTTELLGLIRSLTKENDKLKQERTPMATPSAQLTPLSPREPSDHTDTDNSFEHIGSHDLTDDEADSLARDSPADELSELRNKSPQLLSDKPEDLAVSR